MMEPDQYEIRMMLGSMMPRVVGAVAEQYRVTMNIKHLGWRHYNALQNLIREAMKQQDLLQLVGDQTTVAVGLNENLIEMKLQAVVSHAMRKFVLMHCASQ